MAKKIRKLRKGKMDKGSFGCRFVTTKLSTPMKIRFASKMAMF
jgi:hypothetical protein